jgi:hypothetical protein
MSKKGSAKAGASNAYGRLLSGKISAKQYTETVRRSTKVAQTIQKRAS